MLICTPLAQELWIDKEHENGNAAFAISNIVNRQLASALIIKKNTAHN